MVLLLFCHYPLTMESINRKSIIPYAILLIFIYLSLSRPETEVVAAAASSSNLALAPYLSNNNQTNGLSSVPQTTIKPNYLETGRQITGILDKFMSLGYDKRVRPNYGGPPVEVNVTMRILSISSVSEVMMDFTADFYFRQTWHDPRLSFRKLGDIQTLYVGAEVSKKIWLPDTFFGNEKLAYFHEATTPNVFLRIDHSGEVYRSIRLTVTSSCPMNLQYFPMDRQRCTIEAESYGYNVKDIIYRWRDDKAVERDNQISLPQFDIVKTEQKYRLEELSSGTYSRLIAEIHFARRMGYYLIQIYIPSSLIVVISWVSFWLHRNASPARVQLGVTTVLTMTTLMSSTNAALPKISYVKSIDIFLGTCFIMVFAALLEYATVGYLGKRIAMRKQHAQLAQSQAQARLFAQLQAQGAQGEPVPPMPSDQQSPFPGLGPLGSPMMDQLAAMAAAAAAEEPPGSAGQGPPSLGTTTRQLFRVPSPRGRASPPPEVPQRHCSRFCGASLVQAAENLVTGNCGGQCHCCHAQHHQPTTCCSALERGISNSVSIHNLSCRNHHEPPRPQCRAGGRCNCDGPVAATSGSRCSRGHQRAAATSCSSSHTLPRNLIFAGDQSAEKFQQAMLALDVSPGAATNLHNNYNQQQQQNQPQLHSASTAGHLPPSYGSAKGASAAAAAAAAAFINLHRKNKGLPPSNNPNFAQFAWMNQHNKGLETIFGIRPSDIDKYSRVVFPVCFVCFQLMYWIVYLHISAFLESEQQQQLAQ